MQLLKTKLKLKLKSIIVAIKIHIIGFTVADCKLDKFLLTFLSYIIFI